MAKIKKRLDILVHEVMPDCTEKQIHSWIMQGKVFVDDQVVTKPGTQVCVDAKVVCTAQEPRYVSRAGFKLEKALDHFNINVKDLTVLDAGISTGGFTDCLFQRGARKVYGVDVGYGDVHNRIRTDKRLVLLEKTNVRLLETVGESVDLITLDLSFISVLAVMPTVVSILAPQGQLLVLIKPQFEAGKHEISMGGIVRDEKIRDAIVATVIAGIKRYNFTCIGWIDSPILGTKGNKEFLAYFKKRE